FARPRLALNQDGRYPTPVALALKQPPNGVTDGHHPGAVAQHLWQGEHGSYFKSARRSLSGGFPPRSATVRPNEPSQLPVFARLRRGLGIAQYRVVARVEAAPTATLR